MNFSESDFYRSVSIRHLFEQGTFEFLATDGALRIDPATKIAAERTAGLGEFVSRIFGAARGFHGNTEAAQGCDVIVCVDLDVFEKNAVAA